MSYSKRLIILLIFLMAGCDWSVSQLPMQVPTASDVVTQGLSESPLQKPYQTTTAKIIDIPLASHTWTPRPAKTDIPALTLHSTEVVLEKVTATNSPGIKCETAPQPILNPASENESDVYLSGEFYLCGFRPINAFDFDKGKLGGYLVTKDDNLKGADVELTYRLGESTGGMIRSINGVEIREVSLNHPDIFTCMDAFLNSDEGVFIYSEENVTGCFWTDEERMGYFHIERLNPLGELSIEVTFVVWNLNP